MYQFKLSPINDTIQILVQLSGRVNFPNCSHKKFKRQNLIEKLSSKTKSIQCNVDSFHLNEIRMSLAECS